MKNLKQLLFKRLTIGHLLTILATFIYAMLLKFFLENYFGICPVKGGLTLADVLYFFSIATWKLIFSILLEFCLGERFTIPIATFIYDSNSTVFTMDNKSPSNATSDNSSKSSHLNESSTLSDTMLTNLLQQEEMVDKLRSIKTSNNLKYYDNNGALDVDVPANMGDAEVEKLSRQISDIDNIYNRKHGEYKELEKRDMSLNGINHNKVFSSLSLQHRNAYKNLFEK